MLGRFGIDRQSEQRHPHSLRETRRDPLDAGGLLGVVGDQVQVGEQQRQSRLLLSRLHGRGKGRRQRRTRL